MFSKGIQETAKKIHEYDLSWNYKKNSKDVCALVYLFICEMGATGWRKKVHENDLRKVSFAFF